MASVLNELNKSDLLDLVRMHLSFLIEVTPEEFNKIIENSNEDKCNDKKSSEGCDNKMKKELASNIFGRALTNESLKQAMSLVKFINKNDNYRIEGVFRKSGQISRQQELRNLINCGVEVDLEANRFTPLDCACVLKEFIQKLPEPLLTNNHFNIYYEMALAIKRDTPYDEIETKNAKRLKIVQLLLHLIPDINKQFFVSLMSLLNKVAMARDVTLMDERSLATIFGQHILCPRSMPPKQVQDKIEIIIDAMEFMLLHYDKLFNGPLELIIDAKKKLKKYAERKINKLDSVDTSGDENDTVVTFCRQSHETVTDRALAELYAQVQSLPDTPHKKKLIKQFNKQNGFGKNAGRPTSAKEGSKWKSILPWVSK